MNKRTILLLLAFLLCCIPAFYGLFHAGFFVSDDGHWMIIRLSAFYEALASGQFPVRFLPRINQGIGYPVADFLYPLFLYVGSFIHIFKIPFSVDTKLLFAGSIALSGMGMFLFLRRQMSIFSSFLGGLLFIYLPYHMYDVYVRGSLGEVVALALAPFIFWAIEKKSWLLAACFIGLLILSHNTLALFFLPVGIAYACYKRMPLKHIALLLIVGLGLSAFFWAPALYDKQFTVFDSIAVSNPFGYFVNSVSWQLIGWIGLAIFGGTIFLLFTTKNKDVFFFFAVGMLSVFFSLSISGIFWHSRLLAEFIQFPFRFLSLTIVAESFLGAFLVEKFQKNYVVIGLFILFIGISTAPYMLPKHYEYFPESYYATNVDSTTVKNEYMPVWVKQTPVSYAFQRVAVDKNRGTIVDMQEKGTWLSFFAVMKKTENITISFAYFPGWYATIDGKNAAIAPVPKTGLIQLLVPAGKHAVRLWFGETPIEILADSTSVFFILFVVYNFLKKRYEK